MDKKLNLAFLGHLILILFCFEQNEASLDSQHFVLVHGVTAPDLAASGIDPLQTESLKSISEYFKPPERCHGRSSFT
ncbi:hypothetical protein NL676_015598 [Syzygium grande]|nr:hypothetical protein NL676_015598 [Syzygium grande]